MHAVPLVATTRGYPSSGYVVENVHAGSISVVDGAGRLIAWAG
ncbi:MAG: asparagine amidohydrolase, partial [Massilia sp.]|nr:asparagine amidohydrolase [Massilia sp.]